MGKMLKTFQNMATTYEVNLEQGRFVNLYIESFLAIHTYNMIVLYIFLFFK